MTESARAAGVPVLSGAPAVRAYAEDGGYAVELGSGNTVRGRTLVVARGVRARNLPEYPREARWPGVLVGPGSSIVAQDYSGLEVAVLGGRDNAFENFVYVRNRGARTVHLFARTVRAQQQWVARAGSAGVHVGDYRVDPVARTVNGQRYDLILVFYGWEPQAAFADGLMLARDERGYIRTDFATAMTSLSGVYAIGEVANRMHPCVVTSMADGVVAAKAIQRGLERAL
jgi:thioredoxin reductase